MTTILVWYLVTLTHVNSGNVLTYSPPMADLTTCTRLKEITNNLADGYNIKSQCVQIPVVKEMK